MEIPCINMGYWPSVISRWLDLGQVPFCWLIDRDEVEVRKLAEKEGGQYSAVLTEQASSIKENFSWDNTARSPERNQPTTARYCRVHLAYSRIQPYNKKSEDEENTTRA